MKRIEIIDVNGTTWHSDPDADGELQAHEDDIVAILRNFREIDYLSLEIDGAKRYFNPANIVCAAIIDVPTEPTEANPHG